jgi:hypothetical protein
VTISIFCLVVLAACWWVGDQVVLTKVIFSLLVLASFGLFWIPVLRFLFVPTQCALIAVVGGTTFGTEWLRRRR